MFHVIRYFSMLGYHGIFAVGELDDLWTLRVFLQYITHSFVLINEHIVVDNIVYGNFLLI